MPPREPLEETPGGPLSQQKRRNALWTAGAAAGLLLLLAGIAWRVDGPDAVLSNTSRLQRFFRRPLSHGEEEGPIVGPARGRMQREPSLRRPGTTVGNADDDGLLWALEPRCLASLYHGTGDDETSCGCGTDQDHGRQTGGSAPAALEIVDGPDGGEEGGPLPPGSTLKFTLRSAHGCSDVLDAAFHSLGADNALGAQVMIPARVVALDTGKFAVSATLPYGGKYTFKVRGRQAGG